MRNLVVFYATVETIRAMRRKHVGTAFVRHICQVLNSMEKSELLINVLTLIQSKIHGDSIDMRNIIRQTPEIKIFGLDSKFIISARRTLSPTNDSSSSDAIGSKKLGIPAAMKGPADIYNWKSRSGLYMRRRLAFIFYSVADDDVTLINQALSQNLNFETGMEALSKEALELYCEDASKVDSNVGCVLTCVFGRLSETPEQKEMFVLMDQTEVAVTDIVHSFIGPANDKWIGKPKIFIFVDQQEESPKGDNISPQDVYDIQATNHSGWLVLVLRSRDKLKALIEIFQSQELKGEKCLQEMLATCLLVSNSRDMLNSTLPYHLYFPDVPRPFVAPQFSVKITEDPPLDKTLDFGQLLEEVNGALNENRTWILSSGAGSGKTTVMKEIQYQLGKSNPDVKMLFVSLPSVGKLDTAKFLEEKAAHLKGPDKCFVFLDAFNEVSTDNHGKVLKLIEAFEVKKISVWIATRPHEASVILRAVSNPILVSIKPFDKKNQVEFVSLETNKSDKDCESFIETFPIKDILGNPLHLSLVINSGGNLYQIYDKVLRQKVEMCLVQKGYDKNNEILFQNKVDSSMKLLERITFQFLNGADPKKSKQDLEKLYSFGVANLENDRLTFSHESFAGFFTAQKYLHDVEENGTSDLQLFDEDLKLQAQGSPKPCELRRIAASCRKFVDLFYATASNEKKKIRKHRKSVQTACKSDANKFTHVVIAEDLKHIFNMLKIFTPPYVKVEGKPVKISEKLCSCF
ncbi:Hypothetical predicted protein [Cloeon dipterum]|nr:Hypothetical predicted protein [Cloeon dipterum]